MTYVIIIIILLLISIIPFTFHIYPHAPIIKESFIEKTNNFVIITSVIYTSKQPLRSNYNYELHERSVLSSDDRLVQTLNTIKSMRKNIPNPTIVLIEGSELTETDISRITQAGCDHIYNVSDKLKHLINSENKSFAEVNMILNFLQSDYFTKLNLETYKTFSKISGRYHLTQNYDFNKYSLDKVLCQSPYGTRCNTRYYRIPFKFIDEYREILKNALVDDAFSTYKTDIEDYNIFKTFKPDDIEIVKPPDKLGVMGMLAPTGDIVEDFFDISI